MQLITHLEANQSVRKIDDETMRLLRIQAAKHGTSMEEERRKLLGERFEQFVDEAAGEEVGTFLEDTLCGQFAGLLGG